MSRDPRKLRVFGMADSLVIHVYEATTAFPDEERFGLTQQLRRAAVSAACNIVEGSARRTTRDYVKFLHIATGSAAEARYLVDICLRLKLLTPATHSTLNAGYTELLKGLQRMTRSLEDAP